MDGVNKSWDLIFLSIFTNFQHFQGISYFFQVNNKLNNFSSTGLKF